MKQGFFYLAISLLFLNCSTSKVKTYVDPNFSNSQVKSIGLLPLRNNFTQTNASLSTGDMLEINKLFQKEFITKNPNAKILNAVETSDLLNAKMLVNDYDNLLQVYGSTGIPNTTVLQNIGRELKIDAIAQGFVTKVVQNDGSYGRVNGETSITVKYVMFSTKTGVVLWEVIADGSKVKSTLAKAPPVEEVLEILRKKIAAAVPKL